MSLVNTTLETIFTIIRTVSMSNRPISFKIKTLIKIILISMYKLKYRGTDKYGKLPNIGILPILEVKALNIFLKNRNFQTFIDVGAHIGKYSLMMSILNKNGKVFSMEPYSDNMMQLRNNLKYYGLENVKPFEVACYSRNTSSKLYLAPMSGAGHSLKNIMKFKNYNVVKCIRLDSLIKEKIIDIIKIDVEGSELDVLKGCENILNKTKYIVFESMEIDGAREIAEFLRKFGFTIVKTQAEFYYLATNDKKANTS